MFIFTQPFRFYCVQCESLHPRNSQKDALGVGASMRLPQLGLKKRIPRPSISELPDDSASEGMHVSLSFVEAEVLEKLNIIVLVSQRIIVFHILSELPLDSMPNSGKSL
jgi:hypothetical protein